MLTAYARLSLPLGSSLRTGVKISRTASLPCREDVLSLLGPGARGEVRDRYGDQSGPTPVISVLNSWCERLTGHRCVDTASACRVLLERHEQAVVADFAQAYAAEIGALHRRLVPLAQLRPDRHALSRRCPVCGLLTLVAAGPSEAECTNPDCDMTDHQARLDRPRPAWPPGV